MAANALATQIDDETLSMITLPGGELHYMAPSGESWLGLSGAPEPGTHWEQLVPEEWHKALQETFTALNSNTADIKDTAEPGQTGTAAIRIEPLRDTRKNIIAFVWYRRQSHPMSHHYEMFHNSAIAQWIVDFRLLFHYLRIKNLHNLAELNKAIEANPGLTGHLRSLLNVIDANISAAQLYNIASIAEFKHAIIARISDDEMRQIAQAIIFTHDKPRRQTHQTEITFSGEETRSLWLSCEIPSLADIDHGMFISALNITLLRQAEHESEERQQFLSTILRAVPDILMVFDFKRRAPIFQNIDLTKVLGYTDQDLEDTQGHILNYITHPDDAINSSSLKAIYAGLAGGDTYESTLRLQHNNGEWHHFYFRSAALDKDEDGNILNAVVVARDITQVLKAQQILNEQQQRYQLLADNFSDVVITTDTTLKINYVSPSVLDLLAYTPEQFIGQENSLARLGLSEKEIGKLESALADSVLKVDSDNSDFSNVLETEAIAESGLVIPVELKISILRDTHNLLEGVLIVVRDLTERRKIDADQRLAAKVFENSTEAIYITNPHGDIVQVNKAFVDITGYKPGNVVGKKPSQLGSGWHHINFATDIKPVLDEVGQWSGELMSRRASGEAFLVWMSISHVTDSRGELLGIITSFRDITEAKSSEESIRKLAYYDPLTDLPNRMLFHDRLLQALQRANRNRHYVAVLFMDLDGFKAVNDVLGHAMGDRLLTEAAKRLKECIRSDDTVARMGGDEFTVILNALINHEAAENAAAQVARKIISALNMPFIFAEKIAQIGVSIGIALYPDDSLKEDELIKLADTAMYHAKQSGKNNYQFYTRHMHQRAEQHQMEELDLHTALHNGQLLLAFQPKLMASDQSLSGFEALLRWQHPQKGLLFPSNFMRSLDNLSLSHDIGQWVLDAALSQVAGWLKNGRHDCGVSVNIFSHHYHHPDFVNSIIAALEEHHVPPHLLTIEITEALIMDDLGFAYSVLSDLRAAGVRIAIDDFATGAMSLSSLSRLPVDEIKIDRQFISQIDTEKEQLNLVKAIIGIANTFGFDVVAEGVERPEQLSALLQADCPKVQGFLFYRPLLKNDLEFYLRAPAQSAQ